MTLKQSILGTLGVRVFGIGCGVVTSIVTARLLGASGKGDVALALASSQFAITVSNMGIPTALSYSVAAKRCDMLLLRKILLLYLSLSVLFFVICLLSQITNTELIVPNSQRGILISTLLGVNMFSSLTASVLTSWLSGFLEFKAINRSVLVLQVLQLILYIALFLTVAELSAFVVIGLTVFQNVFSLGLLIRAIQDVRQPEALPQGNTDTMFSLIHRGAKVWIADFCQFLNYRFDVWLIVLYCGTVGLGKYSLAVGLAQYLWIIPGAVATVLFPAIAADYAGNREKAVQAMRLTFGISVFGGALAAALAFPCVPLLYGDEFRDSAIVLLILLAGVVPFCVTMPLASMLAGCDRMQDNLYASIVGVCVTLCVGLPAISAYGILGAALATTLSYWSTTTYVLFAARKQLGLSPRKLLVPNSDDYSLVCSLLGKFARKSTAL